MSSFQLASLAYISSDGIWVDILRMQTMKTGKSQALGQYDATHLTKKEKKRSPGFTMHRLAPFKGN